MKDHHDTSTIDAFEKRGAGRPRRYASNAERQAAYRARRSAVPLSAPAPVVSERSALAPSVAVDLVDPVRELVARLVPSSSVTMTLSERASVYDRLSGAWDLALVAGCFEAAELLSSAQRRLLANVTVTK